MSSSSHAGSCLCNAVRYTASSPPLGACICHCTTCRRSVGAAGVAWAAFRRDELVIEGTPTWHSSSEHARRGFCGDCGTSLFFASIEETPEIEVTVASLHDADTVVPRHRSWVPDRLAWETIADELPRYRREGGSERMED